ncbi:CHAT domain-containing protein [Parahaliea mediterranea]|uniref:CHAT domain-containing protein n=1 Tax=Parahaliea mediterranea TaxID=651086 RepID=UPI001300955A|nr:CHAT domain-containing protein [Parahaliea mediterranea]
MVPVRVAQADPALPLGQAQALADRGELNAALAVLEQYPAGESGGEAQPLPPAAALLRVDVLRRLGRVSRAELALSQLQAQLAAGARPEPALTAQALHQQALLHLLKGELAPAEGAITEALQWRQALAPTLRASLLNDAAIIQQRRGDSAGALADFAAAAQAVAGTPQALVYRVNAARALLEDGQVPAFLDAAQRLADELRAVPSQPSPPAPVLHSRIALAALYREAVNRFGADQGYRLQALQLLEQAGRQSPLAARDESLVKGYMAGLYADDRQFDSALRLARGALLAASRAGSQDLEYRWEWLLAQSFSSLGDNTAAIDAYGRAVASLQTLRANLEVFDQASLATVIQPLYYEYADLLLQQSIALEEGAEKQALLQTARSALEGLKLAEVEDYFQQQCLGDQAVQLDALAGRTAVLYPVLLEDRLELLLSTGDDIHQLAVAVDRATLVTLVRDFRLNLEADTGTDDYLDQARRLYGYLVEPLLATLEQAGVDTLVFVPDGPLRTIPLAALHDGKRFLIERFALATAPGLTLIDPKPFAGRSYTALAGGLSESVQGFPALPSVSTELDNLNRLVDASVLANGAFTLNRVEGELASGDYSVVHFATHGQFGGSYDDSFLLTYDSRLRINELGRTIQSRAGSSDPLELLVLSACETAAGDDRAALGLAGVALKAGARSALATLWEVDDKATLDIITEFYRLLSTAGESKARSLQRAQRKWIQEGGNPHPSQWAPFLLIGNWL